MALRALGLAFLLVALSDCSRATRLGVGPAVAYPGDGRPSYGDVLVLRRGSGSSDFESIALAEYEARLLVTERTQSASLGAGYVGMRWFGSSLGAFSLTPALGAERVDSKTLFNAGLHGGASFGWQLDERVKERPQRSWLALPDLDFGDGARFVTVVRERRVLTLELLGSVDLRGTREPLYALGLLVGLSFLKEQKDVAVPPRPRFLPFTERAPRPR